MVKYYIFDFLPINTKSFFKSAPAVFSVLFNLMKPLMTARTLNKIKIFSADRKKWEPEIRNIIDPAEIRERFGGTKT
jgi:hypothetical protein